MFLAAHARAGALGKPPLLRRMLQNWKLVIFITQLKYYEFDFICIKQWINNTPTIMSDVLHEIQQDTNAQCGSCMVMLGHLDLLASSLKLLARSWYWWEATKAT